MIERRKVHRNYRLSPEACETLNKLREMTGASETAIVEMAIAFYGVLVEKTLKVGSWTPKPELPKPEPVRKVDEHVGGSAKRRRRRGR